jgi:hypothetical protein
MKAIRLAVGLALVVSSAVWAGTQALVTAPAQVPFGVATVLYCQAVNAGTKPVDVTFESHNASGAVVSTLGPQTIAPGAVGFFAESGLADYCRFVVNGSKKNLRAMAIYYDNVGGRYLIAVPAQ